MRTYPDPTHTLHLITRQDASDPDQLELDHEIAQGIRAYQQLQIEFDRELFSTPGCRHSDHPDSAEEAVARAFGRLRD